MKCFVILQISSGTYWPAYVTFQVVMTHAVLQLSKMILHFYFIIMHVILYDLILKVYFKKYLYCKNKSKNKIKGDL